MVTFVRGKNKEKIVAVYWTAADTCNCIKRGMKSRRKK